MRRLVHAIIVALLMLSVSDVSALIVVEPCTGSEQPDRADGACPPTCVTCGCCAQAAEPVLLAVAVTPEIPVAEVELQIQRLPKTSPRDILHIPKRHSA